MGVDRPQMLGKKLQQIPGSTLITGDVCHRYPLRNARGRLETGRCCARNGCRGPNKSQILPYSTRRFPEFANQKKKEQ